MSHQDFPSPEAARSRLRATVGRIGREISRLPDQTTDGGGARPNGLLAFYVDLVEQLGLGPEPDLRTCPVCGHVGRSAATRCGYCWTVTRASTAL